MTKKVTIKKEFAVLPPPNPLQRGTQANSHDFLNNFKILTGQQ
jgi:hypothetical protein